MNFQDNVVGDRRTLQSLFSGVEAETPRLARLCPYTQVEKKCSDCHSLGQELWGPQHPHLGPLPHSLEGRLHLLWLFSLLAPCLRCCTPSLRAFGHGVFQNRNCLSHQAFNESPYIFICNPMNGYPSGDFFIFSWPESWLALVCLPETQ